jgi:hypothetical protein
MLGDSERRPQPLASFLFTFKDASSSGGLLSSVRWQSSSDALLKKNQAPE